MPASSSPMVTEHIDGWLLSDVCRVYPILGPLNLSGMFSIGNNEPSAIFKQIVCSLSISSKSFLPYLMIFQRRARQW